MTREEAQREMPNIFRECIECEHSNVGDYALVAEDYFQPLQCKLHNCTCPTICACVDFKEREI